MSPPTIPLGSTVFVSGQLGYWTVVGYNEGTHVYTVQESDGTQTTASFAQLTVTTLPGSPYSPPDAVPLAADDDHESRITALEEQVELLSNLLGVPYDD